MNETRELNRSGQALFEQESDFISESSRRTLERFEQPLSPNHQKYVDDKKGADSYGASGHVARMVRQFKVAKEKAITEMQHAIVDLFEVLLNNYGYKFLQNYADVGATLRFWVEQVEDITIFKERVQPVHIQVLTQYIKSGHYYPDWPPTAPSALMHVLCDAARSAMGWLPKEQAFSHLRQNKRRAHDKPWLKYQNEGIYFAGEGMSSLDLESNDYYLLRELNEQFSAKYDEATFIQATYGDLLDRIGVKPLRGIVSNSDSQSASYQISDPSHQETPPEMPPTTEKERQLMIKKMRELVGSLSASRLK